MNEQAEEEAQKYNLLQKEMFREKDFLKKIEDIFEMANSEKFQDIIILQKNKYIEQVVKEVLLMLKSIYSENISKNKKFNTIFQLGKKEFEEKYDNYYNEISEEWDIFYDMKIILSTDFSEENKVLLPYAIDFLRNSGGEIIIFHAYMDNVFVQQTSR